MDNNTDYGDMISGMMNDPEAMNNVLKMARSLMGTGGFDSGSASDTVRNTAAETDVRSSEHIGTEAREDKQSSVSALSSVLPAILGDKETAANRERLLIALKPYMNSERRSTIDAILNLLKLAKLADIGSLASLLK